MRMEKALLDTEMTVVRNEFERGENNAQNILEERVIATAYLWHNYGKSVIGSRADLEKRARSIGWRRSIASTTSRTTPCWSSPGSSTPRKRSRWSPTRSARFRSPTRTLDAPYTVEPTQDGERFVELRRVGSSQVVMAAWHGPALAHPDSAALEVLAGIMVSGGGGRGGGAGTGRLYKALVDSKKALNVRMSVQEMHDPGLRHRVRDAQQRPVARRSAQDDDGHDRGRGRPIRRRPTRSRAPGRASSRGWKRGWPTRSRRRSACRETIASGDWRLLFRQLRSDQERDAGGSRPRRPALFQAVQPHRRLFHPDRRSGPDGRARRRRISTRLLKDYKTGLSVSAGEAFDSSPANVEKRLVRATLPNGMKLAMLPKAVARRHGDGHDPAAVRRRDSR